MVGDVVRLRECSRQSVRVTAVLVGVAHGSRDPAAQRTVEALLDAVRERGPDLDVRVAYVQNAEPDLPSVLAGRPAPARSSSRCCSPAATTWRSTSGEGRRPPAPPSPARSGPTRALAAALADRLAEAGAPRDAPVVLAAAGSSDPAAVLDVEAQA